MKSLLTVFAFLSAAAAFSETRIVNVGDFYFQDQVSMTAHSRINVGDSVKWQWISGNHTTTEVNKLWNASINSVSQSYTRLFDEPGVWEYFCAMDPLVMRGTVTVDGKMTYVQPNALDVSPGIIVSGGLAQILASDNQRLVLRPGPVFSSAAFPIVARVSTQIPPGTGDHSLTIRVEAHATSGLVVQRIRLYDPFQEKWVEVRIGFAPTADTLVEATVNDPENYMTPATGTTQAEVSYRAAGPVFTYPWEARLDHIEWIAQ